MEADLYLSQGFLQYERSLSSLMGCLILRLFDDVKIIILSNGT